MQCNICGSNLVRGFTFCLDCGAPVPPEMLEESGLPQRNIDRGPQEIAPPSASKPADDPQTEEQVGDLRPKLMGGDQDRGEALEPQLMGGDTYDKGKALKPKLMGIGEDEAGEALKPRLIGGEENTGGGTKVRAAFQNSSADVSDGNVEKLVFCPNCGMHMQHDRNKCEICGMALGNMPNNVPTTKSGIPLFNTDPDPFSGAGGLGSFGGGFNTLSNDNAAGSNNFAGGNTDPMFNSGSSAFNVQATPADFAQLTEQIANFSTGAGMPDIQTAESTRVRQKEPPKGKEREIDDFSMIDDLQSESVPIVDSNVPVVGDYSMEENPDDDINIDPFAFVGMSMDEEPHLQHIESSAELPEAVPVEEPEEPAPVQQTPEPVPVRQTPEPEPTPAPVIEDFAAEPVQPPSFFGSASEDDIPEETTPFIAEEAPVISESALPSPIKAEVPKAAESVGIASAAPRRPADEPRPAAEQPRKAPVAQSAENIQMTGPAQPMQPTQAAPKPVEKTKQCFACGRSMPVKDKFCPNCGRSMFGIPNPNLAPPAPATRPAKKKPVAFLVIALIVIIAAVVIGFFMFMGKAAEIDFDELAQTVSDSERTFSENITGYYIS